MVRVPGSLGDSGSHRESVEDVQVRQELRDEVSSQIGSTAVPLNEARSANWQSPGRSSVDRKREEGSNLDPDLEEKLRFPPQIPTGPPADHDANRGLQNSGGKSKEFKASASEAPKSMSTKKKKKSKVAQKKRGAPESDEEGAGSRKITPIWKDNTLERAYHRKAFQELLNNDTVMKTLQLRQMGDPKSQITTPSATSDKLVVAKNLFQLLKDAGFVAGAFDADDLFDFDIV
ncbi:hypothetical protein PC129_g19461 [Phytophthora cactorum]|uniref:Uncharacterized protein n=1 Tax=Phytophthora cactorum TaxID=29920 RepID=A0A329RMG7_9STRA|nr:hypothetical protein Pcac1_g6695 [Phytophthora cactorum]KAG2818750.1 hypothetical protein PC112_g12468 [Phytophthora cactorum]KAG2820855.1 hypothetical protein PC111_g11264 [Phytophthora cactorum]KAG2834482.1 hypothetical protein PC113_g20387 [Phytophthora cactorum]KAG2879524.1 hypothetical protein PC114_g22534 [Phytophthora cactorum]